MLNAFFFFFYHFNREPGFTLEVEAQQSTANRPAFYWTHA